VSRRLGVLGGTFDPVHIGHLIMGEAAREQLSLDRVLFVPTGQPWRKSHREITAASHRVEMLRLALAGNEYFELSPLEIDRDGPSYSEITLRALGDENPGADLFFILGRDALDDLPNWHDPSAVVRLATLVVAGREGVASSAGESSALARLKARIVPLDMPVIGVSSTDIRERSAAGRSVRYLVPDAVAEYIGLHGLFRK
jgi:nicotinate-nucleotide adenylyltransferase